MISGARLIGIVVILAGAGGCGAAPRSGLSRSDTALLGQREARLRDELAHPDSDADAPIARWEMPDALREISGLALTPDGRLLTHGDNRGKVFEIDYRRGELVKEFTLGDPIPHADFEAITVVGDTIVLLSSDGVLYRFTEGRDGQRVNYVTQDTGLGERCEFEGLAFDPATKSLLLACKHVHAKAMRDSLLIYRWPLSPAIDTGKAKHDKQDQEPGHLAVPIARVIGSNGWTELHPSDITIDPFNGNYVLIASREKALFEITPSGEVVFARPLPPGHDQAEGVAITRDSILIISDEARGGPALMTLYRWRR